LKIGYFGSLKTHYIKEGIEQYRKWLKPYGKYELVAFPSGGDINRFSNQDIIERERDFLFKRLKKDDYLILMDSGGENLSTESLACFLKRAADEGVTLFFLIGGYLGVDIKVKQRADRMISISGFTLTHEVALLLLYEQLYRTAKINRGEKYHY
jgi:23S rRNA (pseudouridine1915-N3)-methyltransferase